MSLSTICLGYSRADFNNDGIVDFIDLAEFAAQWLQEDNEAPKIPKGLNCFYPKAWDLFIDDDDVVWQNLCSDATEWSKGSSDPVTLSDHDDSIGNEYSQTNGSCVKVAFTGSGTATVTHIFDSAQDFSECFCKFNYFIPDFDYDPTKYPRSGNQTVVIFLKDSSWKSAILHHLPYTKGYHSIEFSCGGMKDQNGIDFTDITRIQVVIFGGVVGTEFFWDSIQFIQNYSRPRVVLTFDNGLQSHYDVVRPLLNARGMKGVFYVVKDFTDTAGYMTTAELLQLQSEGHLIGNHSATHRNWVLDPKPIYYEMVEEMFENRRWMKSIGIKEGRFYYCHPTGSPCFDFADPYDRFEALRFLCQYHYHVRMTEYISYVDGVVAHIEGSHRNYTFPNIGGFRTLSFSVQVTTFDGTPAYGYLNGKDLIGKAVAHNDLVSLYWHDIGAGGDISTVQFTALLDYIQSQGLEVVTWADLMPWEGIW